MKKRTPIKTNYNPNKKTNRGAPAKFFPRYVKMARTACAEMGATKQQLAELFDVSVQTIYNWEYEYPDFFDAVYEGKKFWTNKKIVTALKRRALGYDYTETKRTEIILKRQKDKKRFKVPAVKVETWTKRMAEHPGCLMFLACNNMPDKFRDLRHADITVHDESEKTLTHKFVLDELKGYPLEKLEEFASILSELGNEVPPKEKMN